MIELGQPDPLSAPPALVIRADASATIGTGHVMRMLALAQAWRARPQRVAGEPAPLFLCAEIAAGLVGRLTGDGFRVAGLDAPIGSAADGQLAARAVAPGGWVVADGYRFGFAFQAAVRGGGARLMLMDDNGENGTYDCELVLNQNVAASESAYRDRAPATRLLLGTRYALLREEFVAPPAHGSRPAAQGLHVLVTMGGSDPGDATRQVLDALGQLARPRDHVTVVVGAGNPRAAALEQQLAPLRWASARLAVGVTDMAGLMGRSDLAITAGGSTCWELCRLGVPMLVLGIADNQRSIVHGLAAAGAAISAGGGDAPDVDAMARQVSGLLADAELRAALAARARELVDGQGAARVCAALQGVVEPVRGVS